MKKIDSILSAAIFKHLSFIAFALLFSISVANADPVDPKNYTTYKGSLMTLPNGTHIEGSFRKGGMQPDYIMDLDSPDFRRVLDYGKSLKKSKIGFWEKIQRIEKYIERKVFLGVHYEDARYRRVSKNYLRSRTDIPLSRYLSAGSGVCREHALVMHQILLAAGIENFHAYAKIRRSSVSGGFDIYEDHAFNVVRHEGKLWVVDSYYWGFNGYLLQDLVSAEGITEKSLTAPIATPGNGFRRILEFNSFPQIWVPKNLTPVVLEIDKEHIPAPYCPELLKSTH